MTDSWVELHERAELERVKALRLLPFHEIPEVQAILRDADLTFELRWPEPVLPPVMKFEPYTFVWDGPVETTTRRCGPFILTSNRPVFRYQKAITA